MANERKQFGLKPVPEAEETVEPIIRLESKETLQRARAPRLNVQPQVLEASHRLEIPARPAFESRTHQPKIDALINTDPANSDQLEQAWENNAARHQHIPWGWFVLLALILASAVIWSLSGVKKAEEQTDKLVAQSQSALESESEENLKASQLIDRIDKTIRTFFAENNVDARSRLVRHPERVRPLMEAFYGTEPIPPKRHLRTELVQSLTIDSRSNFWVVSAKFADQTTLNLILEILDTGEPLIDWEMMVNYQPMPWDRYATERPANTSLDFRVYIEADNLFSHEFADPSRWICFRLTAQDSDESLFGYANANEPIGQDLLQLLNRNQGQKTAVILRLNIPAGLQSRRGVIIEKLVSPRWIYVDPPES